MYNNGDNCGKPVLKSIFIEVTHLYRPYRSLEEKDKALAMFIPEEDIQQSYVYTHIDKKIELKPQTIKVKQKFVPGLSIQIKHKLPSKLNSKEQALVLKALMLFQTEQKITRNEDKFAVQKYCLLKPKIHEENRDFEEKVKNHWKGVKDPFRMKSNLKWFSTYCWKRKLKEVLLREKLYQDFELIPISCNEQENSIEMVHICNALEMGTLGKFQQPNLKKRCMLPISSLPAVNESTTFNSKLPVSKDANIEPLLQANDIDVVISSSGLKRLLNFTAYNDEWDVPVVVKTISKVLNGVKVFKNVVFVDKALPKRKPTLIDLNYKCHKTLIKTNFCQYEAFKFEKSEDNIPHLANLNLINEGNAFDSALRGGSDLQNDATSLESNSKNDSNRSLGDEPGEESKKDFEEGEMESSTVLEETKVKKKGPKRKIHHNVSYRIWSMKQKGEQNELMKTRIYAGQMNVLVRTKMDGCEINDTGVLQPVVVVPKLEYQLEYGGRVPTKGELVNQWTSLFFTPFSHLYRALIHSPTSNVIMLEKCSIQKIRNEALSHYDYKPQLGIDVLYKIFTDLKTLNPGQYLLHHKPKLGPFVALLKTANQDESTFDLHAEYDLASCGVSDVDKDHFHPIDPALVLPAHLELGQAPGLFKGYEKAKNNWKKKKCNQNSYNKKKVQKNALNKSKLKRKKKKPESKD